MEIFGIKIDKLKYKSFLEDILKFEKQNIVFTPNPEILLNTLQDKEYKKNLLKATYLTPDGIGLFLAYQIINSKSKFLAIILFPYFLFNLIFRKKYLYNKFGDRICGSDLTNDLLKICNKKNIKITIIDLYKPNDIQKTNSQKHFKQNLLKKYNNLKFDYYIYKKKEKENIIEKIKDSDSKILFSTLGMKIQEESVIEIMNECKNIKLGLGIGSSFDYIIGFQKRAPKIFRKIGIEWLYRLITGPQKINRLKRLYNAIIVFSYKVIISKK